jgi:S1-C subfamily serine protease
MNDAGDTPSTWQRPTVGGTLPPPSVSGTESSTPPTSPGHHRPPTLGAPLRPPLQPPTSPLALPPEAPKRRRGWRVAGVGVLVVAAMVGSGVVGALIMREIDREPLPPQRASDASLSVSEDRTEMPDIDVGSVVEYVAPSIVTISADVPGPLDQVGQSVGTGVITTADGEVVTNAHVVEDATEIRVRLAGESEPREATLLASDPGNDLALLRIAGDDFVPAQFAQPGTTRIGDEVLAIGFALDLDGDPSVTLGIVSALGRTIQTSGDGFLDGLIQTDAAISSGNSGGPLVNSLGEVVGINTAVARGDTFTAATNVGFAISVAEALPVIDQLRAQADGAVRADGYLGVSLDERRDGGQGSIVATVEPGSGADAAGLLAGDIVIEVDGTAINGSTGLVAAIRDREPGDEVEITILREGELEMVVATLGTRPEDPDE